MLQMARNEQAKSCVPWTLVNVSLPYKDSHAAVILFSKRIAVIFDTFVLTVDFL